MSVDQSRARVPTQNCVVVSRGPHLFGLFIPGHRVSKGVVGHASAAHAATMQIRLTTTL